MSSPVAKDIFFGIKDLSWMVNVFNIKLGSLKSSNSTSYLYLMLNKTRSDDPISIVREAGKWLWSDIYKFREQQNCPQALRISRSTTRSKGGGKKGHKKGQKGCCTHY